ncbi:hypothetical protein D3C80_1877030 [compost metagenome]
MTLTAIVDISVFELVEIPVSDGNELRIRISGDRLTAELLDGSGEWMGQWVLERSADRALQQRQSDLMIGGVQFAEPLALSEHPVMERQAAAVGGETEE